MHLAGPHPGGGDWCDALSLLFSGGEEGSLLRVPVSVAWQTGESVGQCEARRPRARVV